MPMNVVLEDDIICCQFVGKPMATPLGEYIAKLREGKGWSVRELGRRAKLSGEAVRKIEQGITENPGVDAMRSIADALGVNPHTLLDIYLGQDPRKLHAKKLLEEATPEELDYLRQVLEEMK